MEIMIEYKGTLKLDYLDGDQLYCFLGGKLDIHYQF